MPVITKIEPQKNKKRVNVHLDGEFSFGLDIETYMKSSLKVGQNLADEEVKQIVKKSEFKSALDKLLHYSTLRPRSEKEINDWLKRKKVAESLHKELFNKLKHLKLLDDENFAKWWVGQRLQFKNRSIRELANELYKKGIDKNIIEEVLKDSEISEESSAGKLLEKRSFAWRKYTGWEKRKKMSDYLARKGFSWDVIKKVVKE
ncbi:RecX family transcriptional regulator [Candidatus Woesebacteria bacterium]|nr:RecX family transcriptional regulator [Candidatus Woesebacteria bacterium]